MAGKAMLTCFWRGYNGGATNPRQDTNVHKGESVNLVFTDGHAATWRLPSGLNPIWAWFGGQVYTAAGFDTNDFYKQNPWWWVLADSRDE